MQDKDTLVARMINACKTDLENIARRTGCTSCEAREALILGSAQPLFNHLSKKSKMTPRTALVLMKFACP